MEKPQKRTKTATPCIYRNEKTGRYDVKYNFSEYDPVGLKNRYRSKWICGFDTVREAKQALASCHSRNVHTRETEITLKGAYELWEKRAYARNLSPVTILNTKEQCEVIYRFFPENTKIKNLTEENYYAFARDMRASGLSEESIHTINATFRKLINLCYRGNLIPENFLERCDNIHTKKKENYRLINTSDFDLLDSYFMYEGSKAGPGEGAGERFLFQLLYFTGLRIGEALALTFDDFEEDMKTEKGSGSFTVIVTKSYTSRLGITKTPKNEKNRSVPLADRPSALFRECRDLYLNQGGKSGDVLFPSSYNAYDRLLKRACRECGLPAFHCHEFRHTFISSLIAESVPITVVEYVSGDTQQTILKRYSHMFENGKSVVSRVMNGLFDD